MPAEINTKIHDRQSNEDDPFMQSIGSMFEEEVSKLNGVDTSNDSNNKKNKVKEERDEEYDDGESEQPEKVSNEPKKEKPKKQETDEQKAEKRLLEEILGQKPESDDESNNDTDEESDDESTDEEITKDEEQEDTKEESDDESNDEDDDDSNPHQSKHFAERLKKAKQKARKKAEEEYEAKMAKLQADYEKQIEETRRSVEENAPSQEVIDEYMMLKRKYDVENDPEITKQFNPRIQSNDLTMRKILKKYYPSEKIDQINNITEFAQSQSGAWQEALDAISEHSNSDVDILRIKFADNMSAQEEKSLAIESASKQAKEYFAKIQEEQIKTEEKKKLEQTEYTEKINKYKQEVFGFDAFKIKDPSTAKSTEEAKKIEKHNNTAQTMRKHFDKMLTASTLEDEIEIRAAAAMAFRFKTELEDAKSEVNKWRKKYEERANAGKVGSNYTQSRSSGIPARKSEEPTSMEAMFEAAARKHLG